MGRRSQLRVLHRQVKKPSGGQVHPSLGNPSCGPGFQRTRGCAGEGGPRVCQKLYTAAPALRERAAAVAVARCWDAVAGSVGTTRNESVTTQRTLPYSTLGPQLPR